MGVAGWGRGLQPAPAGHPLVPPMCVCELITIQVPRVVGVEIEVGDDVGVAGQQRRLAVEEMDDELLVGRVEPETGWHVEVAIPHRKIEPTIDNA